MTKAEYTRRLLGCLEQADDEMKRHDTEDVGLWETGYDHGYKLGIQIALHMLKQ